MRQGGSKKRGIRAGTGEKGKNSTVARVKKMAGQEWDVRRIDGEDTSPLDWQKGKTQHEETTRC